MIAAEVHSAVEPVKERLTCNEISPQSAAKYCRTVVKRLNVSGKANDKRRKKCRTGLIKVSDLSNTMANKSGTRLAWIVFHKIAHMYRDARKQETLQASLLNQGLQVNFESTKAAGTSPATSNIYIPLQPTMPLDPTTVTTVPEDLEDIQPRPSQVWNWDEIDFDPNGS